MELKEEEDDDWDDDQAAPLPTLPQKQEEHRAPWQRSGQQPISNPQPFTRTAKHLAS